jgi:site-specific DNA-methyltransferase (adenine-specific)
MKAYYSDDLVTIYHGDCRDVSLALAPRTVDLTLTDPPYGMAFVSGWTVEKATVKSDGVRQGVRIVRSALNELSPCFSDDMHLLVFCHWESWPDFYDALSHIGQVRNALVWYKSGGGMGDLRHEYAKDYEVILFAARGRGRELRGSRTGCVLRYNRVATADRLLPFEKPVDLLSELIDRHTQPGGLVLDPFMGSGSTLVAAKLRGRRAIGIELDEARCELAAERLRQEVLDLGVA